MSSLQEIDDQSLASTFCMRVVSMCSCYVLFLFYLCVCCTLWVEERRGNCRHRTKHWEKKTQCALSKLYCGLFQIKEFIFRKKSPCIVQLAALSPLPSFDSSVLGHLLFFPIPGTHWYLTFFWLVEFIEANWKKWSPFPATKWNRGTFAIAGGLQGMNLKGPGGFFGSFWHFNPVFKPISRQTDLIFKGGRYRNDCSVRTGLLCSYTACWQAILTILGQDWQLLAGKQRVYESDILLGTFFPNEEFDGKLVQNLCPDVSIWHRIS